MFTGLKTPETQKAVLPIYSLGCYSNAENSSFGILENY